VAKTTNRINQLGNRRPSTGRRAPRPLRSPSVSLRARASSATLYTMGDYDGMNVAGHDSGAIEFAAAELTTFDVAEDGSVARIGVKDASGRCASLTLPVECLSALLMTLPQMVKVALQCRHDDPSVRLVYPLGGYSVETARGSDQVILTLATPDGFEVAFALTAGHRRELIDAFQDDAWRALGRVQ